MGAPGGDPAVEQCGRSSGRRPTGPAVEHAYNHRVKIYTRTGDSGDTSVADETASEAFAEAELDSTVSGQVRDALRRIQDGTYGLCVIDNLPIEPARLEAVPWTPYCLKHQESIEAAARSKTSTL